MAPTTRPIDARGWIFEVEDLDAGVETWLPILGLNTFTNNPGENEEVAETVVFESEGAYEQDIMQRGATLSLEGQYRVDKTTGEQSAGQAYIDTVMGEAVGVESRGNIRWRHKSQSAWVVWEATATRGEQGGGSNEKTTWAATFTRCGLATTAAVTP